jgi:hypothetical protein
MQAQKLAYRAAGTTFLYDYPKPISDFASRAARLSPIASITAVDTWTDFETRVSASSHIKARYPWYFCRDYSWILAIPEIISEHQVRFSMRVQTETCVSAVAGVNGRETEPTVPVGQIRKAMWAKLSYGGVSTYKLSRAQFFIEPTVPAAPNPPIVCIVPQIKVVEDDYPLFNLGGTPAEVRVHLSRMVVLDLPASSLGR